MNELTNTSYYTNYNNYINSFPLLSYDEEVLLANHVYKNNDREAAQKLILPHLRLVVSIARGFKNYELPLHDLIQEGNIGLMKAVQKFDPNKGARLSTFAGHYIKGYIYEYIINNWKPIRIATSKPARKIFYNLRKFAKEAGKVTESERIQLAEKLNVSLADIHNTEQGMKSHFDDGYISKDGEHVSFEEIIKSDDALPEEVIETTEYEEFIKFKVMAAIDELSDRERDIILSRKFTDTKPVTLSTLSKKYNISTERVRQLEVKAIKTLEQVVTQY